jgi:4-carboxymuconolactone decarboxylase
MDASAGSAFRVSSVKARQFSAEVTISAFMQHESVRSRTQSQRTKGMDQNMHKQFVGALIVGLLLSGTATAQEKATTSLPPDIDPVSLTRLPPLTRADLDDEGKAVYDRIVGDGPPPKTGPVPLSLYSPNIAQAFSDLNGFLRYNGELSPRHTEVAILVATWEIEQQYEYSSHEAAALRFGAPQAVIDTIKYDRAPVGLSTEETVIIRLGRQLMREHKVDSELYAEAVNLFGRKGVVELATVMGDYVMVGMVLTTIDQHLPPDRPARLPPR